MNDLSTFLLFVLALLIAREVAKLAYDRDRLQTRNGQKGEDDKP